LRKVIALLSLKINKKIKKCFFSKKNILLFIHTFFLHDGLFKTTPKKIYGALDSSIRALGYTNKLTMLDLSIISVNQKYSRLDSSISFLNWAKAKLKSQTYACLTFA